MVFWAVLKSIWKPLIGASVKGSEQLFYINEVWLHKLYWLFLNNWQNIKNCIFILHYLFVKLPLKIEHSLSGINVFMNWTIGF